MNMTNQCEDTNADDAADQADTDTTATVDELHPYNLTDFQREWAEAKQAQENFGKWIHTRGKRKRRYQGKVLLAYELTNGKLHAAYLNFDSVISEA